MKEVYVKKGNGTRCCGRMDPKEVCRTMSVHDVVESSLSEGDVLLDCKRQNVVQIYKDGDKDNLDSLIYCHKSTEFLYQGDRHYSGERRLRRLQLLGARKNNI